ncbi:ABC transporter substrate-binding protein [Saccharothrix coeruleofusca]|uniref:ABC transporter substrate-binding protein n=1 Tax=Saccharothrix coeruleofusca TaxID=33919 RepID=UPI0016716C42|nr:ABC transporter substrate-binding protein [Saccharothrix coeruleofusca]
MRRALLVLGAVLPLLAVTACGGAQSRSSAGAASSATGPVTVEDCAGRAVTFGTMPERVVALDGYAAQALVRLGLADKVVGTGFPAPFAADTSPHREQLAKIPVLSDKPPVTEVVAAQRPDVVVTAFSAFGGPPGSPKDADLTTMGVKGLTACMPGGGDAGGGGALTDLTPTYDYLRKLGAVFRVPDRAEQVVSELRARARAVADRVGPAGAKPRVLVLQDNPVAGQPIQTAGVNTIAHALITMAGGQSLFTDISSMHAEVSPEQVVQRDPEVIWVVTDYTFAKVRGPELVDAVKDNPLLANTTAAKRGRIVSTSQFRVSFPSPLNVDGLEQLATQMRGG